MRAIGVANVALGGLNRQLDRFEQGAANVVELTTTAEGFAPVDISHEARGVSENLDSTLSAGLEGAMVDLRISKYLAIANMKVLKTADEVADAAMEILR